ncbi:hypothetical protein D9M70_417740 [compost metagenome]
MVAEQQRAVDIPNEHRIGRRIDQGAYQLELTRVCLTRKEVCALGYGQPSQAVAPGYLGQLHARAHLQLLLQVGLVGANRLETDGQLLGDGLVRLPLSQQLQDGHLADGQRIQFPSPAMFHVLAQEVRTPVQHFLDGGFQSSQVFILADEAIGPRSKTQRSEVLGTLPGVDQQLEVGIVTFYPAHEIEAALLGNGQFEDDQVEGMAPQTDECIRTAINLDNHNVAHALD